MPNGCALLEVGLICCLVLVLDSPCRSFPGGIKSHKSQQYQRETVRPIPRYRHRSFVAVPDLEQERAWEHQFVAGGKAQRERVSIDPGASGSVFWIDRQLL